jgi:hypothetical protein
MGNLWYVQINIPRVYYSMKFVLHFYFGVKQFIFAFCIAVWCRRTDELVDGPNSSHITPTALDMWEQRLTDVFESRPYDMFDAALSHTVSKYPVDIQVRTSRYTPSVPYYKHLL